MTQLAFLSSPEVWARGHGPQHPLKPERLQRTHELLEGYEVFSNPEVQLVAPRPATQEELELFHTSEYLGAVRALSSGDIVESPIRYGFGPGDNPVFAGMFESESLKVGAAVQAAKLLLDGKCQTAFSYSGGLHHGGPNFASGFCVFNDAAVAIQWLLERGLRVAYLDIDVHHGDGVQDAFYHTDQVLTISLHQDGRTLFPGTGFIEETGHGAGEGYAVNVPLPPGVDNAGYLLAFDNIVPQLLSRFEPDVLVTQLGVDTHMADPLANLMLTTHGHTALFERIKSFGYRWLALGGGGYAIDVVPRSWTLAAGIMAGIGLPDPLPDGYVKRYGGQWLHDRQRYQAGASISKMLEGVIEQVKRTHRL
jgi:acetoin utilization protein AcuC